MARTGTFSLNFPTPLKPSAAVSPRVKAMSAFPAPTSLMLSTDALVTSAVASTPGSALDEDVREPAAERVIDASGPAGGDGEPVLGVGGCCGESERGEHGEAEHSRPPGGQARSSDRGERSFNRQGGGRAPTPTGAPRVTRRGGGRR